jgi:MFS family permease
MLSCFGKKPKLLVLFFFLITVVLYFDRGCISGLLPRMKVRWGKLNGPQEGVISSSFTVCFMIFCPMYAYLSSSWGHLFPTNYLLSFGFFFWSLSNIVCGLLVSLTKGSNQFWGYYLFILARSLNGIGESAFIALSVSIVDDIASYVNRSSYQSVLLGGVPIGTALGYTVAGFLPSILPWQTIFFIQGFIGILLTTLVFLIPFNKVRQKARNRRQKERKERDSTELGAEELTQLATANTQDKQTKQITLFQGLRLLLTNPVYIFLVLGKSQYIAVIGSLVFWAPTWLLSRLESFSNMTDNKKLFIANFGFSVVLISTSLFGTFFGGFMLDRFSKKDSSHKILLSAKACLLNTIYILLCIPFGLIVFNWRNLNIYALFILLGIGVLLLSCCQSPFQIAILSCCEDYVRDYAISFQILCLRLFGDLPSPTVFGWLSDRTNLDIANVIMWCLLFSW